MRGHSSEKSIPVLPLLGSSSNLITEQRGVPREVLHKFLALDRLRELYLRSRSGAEQDFHENLLRHLRVSCHVEKADIAHIPATGPVVAVANHPFGILEGPLLCTVLPKLRPDFKIMTNQLLTCFPELQEHCIFVDAFNNRKSRVANAFALKESITWLKAGHMLVIFPAGEVSHYHFRQGEIQDPEWNRTAARLIRIAEAVSVPLYFKGKNSLPFQVLGVVHPTLRTARLVHELFNKRGKSVEIRMGTPIPFESLADFPDDLEATEYLRWRTYLLGQRGPRGTKQLPRFMPKRGQDPVLEATSLKAMLADVERLGSEHCVESSRDYEVYLASAGQIPALLREIGRLREITFRQAGEGTGKCSDLDAFDPYYQHLLLWNRQKQELVGAYRIGNASKIIARFGIAGLYTNTLFEFDSQFFARIGPALELGRSFVRPEYQKKFAPLLMLWKGLGKYLADNPETPMLFGAISISNDYNPVSRELATRFLLDRELAPLVRARHPFRHRKQNAQNSATKRLFRDFDSLSAVVSDLEPDGKGLPILLKQYVKLGGKLLGFNVDPHFSDALDGLVLVDLRRTEPEILERYMGKHRSPQFLNYHSAASA